MRSSAPVHKYRIGQNLKFGARRVGSAQGDLYCKVLGLLPMQDGELQYRIKCTSENAERVVKEYALSMTD
jgi:hypothetical protein